jgi:hypothetical protein
MNTLLDLLPDKYLALPGNISRLTLPPSGGLLAIVGPYAASQAMLTLAALLALRGPLQVLDGGNRFNAYTVARLLRRQSALDSSWRHLDLRQALGRIRVARAFTCYQMTALIEKSSLDGQPTLVIDLLDTFYDESAPLEERRRLLERCISGLRKSSPAACPGFARACPGVAGVAPGFLAGPGQAALPPLVVVSLRPPPPGQSDPTGLLETIQSAADQVLYQDLPEPPQLQPRLF